MHRIELNFLFVLKLPRLHQPAVVSLVVLLLYRLCLLVVITRDSPGPLVLFFTIWRDTLYCCPGANPGCIYDVSGLFKLLVMSPLSSFFCYIWNNQLIQTLKMQDLSLVWEARLWHQELCFLTILRKTSSQPSKEMLRGSHSTWTDVSLTDLNFRPSGAGKSVAK